MEIAVPLNKASSWGVTQGRSGSIHRIGLRIKIEVEADDGNLHLYQIGTEADERQLNPGLLEINADNLAGEAKGNQRSCAAAEEGVED